MASKQNTATREAILEQIAREHLHIETLETRKSDSLDFHSVAVWSVEAALGAAYEAGIDELLAAAEALLNAKDNEVETIGEWRALKRAVRQARQTRTN